MIAIIDYGAGNLNSVSKALKKIGAESIITSDPDVIKSSAAMILPGVGSFGAAMSNIRGMGLDQTIIENCRAGQPLLGICLGMQLLFDRSFEDGQWEGLGLLSGDIVKFENPRLKIPHMGWNQLILNSNASIGAGINQGDYVYFVHSYYAVPRDAGDVVFYTEYGTEVPAVVQKGLIVGMQFHPEKSADTGMRLLQNFIELVRKAERA
jgi:glutamine amidotransferase